MNSTDIIKTADSCYDDYSLLAGISSPVKNYSQNQTGEVTYLPGHANIAISRVVESPIGYSEIHNEYRKAYPNYIFVYSPNLVEYFQYVPYEELSSEIQTSIQLQYVLFSLVTGIAYPTQNVAIRYVKKTEYIRYALSDMTVYVFTYGYVAVIHPYQVSRGWDVDDLNTLLVRTREYTYADVNTEIPVFDGTNGRCYPKVSNVIKTRFGDVESLMKLGYITSR